MYKDLREFIELVDKLGALRRIEGAEARYEIGGITEVAAGRPDGPALIFDAIPGFPRGWRIFTNTATTLLYVPTSLTVFVLFVLAGYPFLIRLIAP